MTPVSEVREALATKDTSRHVNPIVLPCTPDDISSDENEALSSSICSADSDYIPSNATSCDTTTNTDSSSESDTITDSFNEEETIPLYRMYYATVYILEM